MVNKNKIASKDAVKEKVEFLHKNNELTSTSVIVPPDGNFYVHTYVTLFILTSNMSSLAPNIKPIYEIYKNSRFA